ncbi:phosphoglycerate mutase-like protein [Periconia macrospinosa]|uniref:Phosphoglycerate mutase-like protein n=1 Tax=Periconia macrospinosa TaxID=97972 RepID=A0A2V1EBK1_9PLEO|nr:phosphoglycerate mutase-like protein [Periconia macrospinosa]
MHSATILSLVPFLSSAYAAETILGAYVFHRHGDRTPKSLAPTNLTALGYEQVYTSGQYFRSRYLTGSSKINAISEDIVQLTQLDVTAPVDKVLQTSAMGFLQGLYPPVKTVQTLAGGRSIQAPMYQLIPVNTIETGAGSEDSSWLQDASSCTNAKASSNRYFTSQEYSTLLESTKPFFQSLVPVVNNTLDPKDVTFKNGYIVYDLVHVAEIHNESVPSSNVLSNETMFQLRTLADTHEWGLAYNISDNTRAISGMQLAGEILNYMNGTIESGRKGSSTNKFGIQFGAYATFLSFFGLVNLPQVSADFTGIPDYASSMAFELFTNADVSTAFPTNEDLQVRFLFHNGTASNSSHPTVYPLFGGNSNELSWGDFSRGLSEFAVSTTKDWCIMCGNAAGTCAQYSSTGSGNDGDNSEKQSSGHGSISPAIGGVIGASVTLAVVLGALAIAMLFGGFTLVHKKALRDSTTAVNDKTKP